tara:strand:+ start:282 stop:887 length:606 start_codon:yes stop_codon:yes gene_type:complete
MLKHKSLLLLIILGLIYFQRINILNAFGTFLVYENNIEFIETAFVLSGGAFDRGNKAAELINTKKVSKVICTGANKPPDFKALNIDLLESELTRKNIISQVQDSSLVSLIKEGTSTLEESEIILAYCLKNNLKECVIISSKFHTRRIKKVFLKHFKKQGIDVFIIGAPSSSFDESSWWTSENGLINLNNEYIKLLYYFVKY